MPSRYADRLEAVTDERIAASLYDEYFHLHNDPLNWEEVDQKTIQSIPELTGNERAKVLRVQSQYPDLEEWKKIEGILPPEVLEILKYAVHLNSSVGVEGHLRWRMKTSRRTDYQSYARLQIARAKGIRGSIVTERDPGERALIDHLAGGLEFSNLPYVDRVVLGQYQLGYGLGLAFGPALGLAKSGNALSNVDRSYMRLRINESSLESLGFTGIAGRTHFGHHHMQVAGALTARDGSWDGERVIISRSGLHITEGSLYRKNRIAEQLENAAYWYTGKTLDMGVQYARMSRRRWTDPGWLTQTNFGSIWFITPYLSHETSVDRTRDCAHLTTLKASFGEMEIAVAHRWYAPGNDVPFASGFGEFSGTANETGWYTGVQMNIGAIRVSGYVDLFTELIAEKTGPREGDEWMLRADWHPRSRMVCAGSIKSERKETIAPKEEGLPEFEYNILRKKREYEIRWRYRWSNGFTADVRTEFIIVDYPVHKYEGNQWAYKLTIPFGRRNRLQCFCVPYNVESSAASTYYFVMPVTGTMQLLRQTGMGVITGAQARLKFSKTAETTIFYLQRHSDTSKLTHSVAVQMDIAF